MTQFVSSFGDGEPGLNTKVGSIAAVHLVALGYDSVSKSSSVLVVLSVRLSPFDT